jgi:hypothetical protein
MVDEDGYEDVLSLLPPASAAQLAELQANVPCPIPEQVREVLAVTRGFENGPLESLDFAGVPGGFGLEEIFPHPLALAHDGYGNYWVADLQAASIDWAPIYFACHDPAVIVFQSPSLQHFVAEVLRFANPPHESEINDVHEQHSMAIWRRNPDVLSHAAASSSPDPTLRSFAQGLDPTYSIVDLRGARTGHGFSWGRYGPKTRVVRCATEPIFAYQSKSRWQRLLGR